ncbi:hypothetical protein BUALT_Bualt05G0126300 [Buddleja alternifolia]|uniref:G-patch domain-containing protein n=1 Tax=Buddleja alternifolia TaxID=168488 RepID=A0AAV6XV55_9LAMI|nr:hypothetical protein BUALT_Bualt05G0126300 [Buddleja alternifolia]
MPVKTPIDNFIKEKQDELVVIEHVTKSNPEKQIFSEVCMQPCDNSKTQSKMKRSNDCQVMEKCLIMPITKIDPLPRTKSSPIRVSCKKLQGTFNPKAYKLLEKSGYGFSNPSGLGKLEPKLTGEKIHGLTKAQYKLRKQGYHVDQPKTGLGFMPTEPVKIHVTKKEKCVTVQHISAGSDDKGKQPSDNRVSVFNRLGTLTTRSSIFKRLGVSSCPQSSIFNRLGAVNIQQQKKRNLDWKMDMMESRSNEKTLLLSQPQGNKSSLVLITMDGSMNVKQCIIRHSGHSNENALSEDEVEPKQPCSSNNPENHLALNNLRSHFSNFLTTNFLKPASSSGRSRCSDILEKKALSEEEIKERFVKVPVYSIRNSNDVVCATVSDAVERKAIFYFFSKPDADASLRKLNLSQANKRKGLHHTSVPLAEIFEAGGGVPTRLVPDVSQVKNAIEERKKADFHDECFSGVPVFQSDALRMMADGSTNTPRAFFRKEDLEKAIREEKELNHNGKEKQTIQVSCCFFN